MAAIQVPEGAAHVPPTFAGSRFFVLERLFIEATRLVSRAHVEMVTIVAADRRKSDLPKLVTAAIRAADDRKARDIVALDLRGLTDATDFFVVASANSDAHVRGVANGILEQLESIGVPAHHVEGVQAGRWALLDFVDFVVHIFHPESRAFYQLERLWNDAPRFAYPLAPERKA